MRRFPPRRPSADFLCMLAMAAVAFALRAWNATGTPFPNDDEGTYLAQAWAVQQGRGLAHYTYRYDHPPLGWTQLAALSWAPALLLPALLVALWQGSHRGTRLFSLTGFVSGMLPCLGYPLYARAEGGVAAGRGPCLAVRLGRLPAGRPGGYGVGAHRGQRGRATRRRMAGPGPRTAARGARRGRRRTGTEAVAPGRGGRRAAGRRRAAPGGKIGERSRTTAVSGAAPGRPAAGPGATIWHHKLDRDPAVMRAMPRGWRDIDYVVSTPALRDERRKLPTLDAALRHSRVVAVFGEGAGRIEILRVGGRESLGSRRRALLRHGG